MTNTHNQVLANNGSNLKKTGVFTNLLYNIRNQNFGDNNYLNYKNDAWKSGHHYAEIASNQDGATWYFQEAEENIGIVPLYNIRNQNLGDNNYLNYKDEAWADGKHYAEICPKMQGSSWWLSTSETTEKINTPSGN